MSLQKLENYSNKSVVQGSLDSNRITGEDNTKKMRPRET